MLKEINNFADEGYRDPKGKHYAYQLRCTCIKKMNGIWMYIDEF